MPIGPAHPNSQQWLHIRAVGKNQIKNIGEKSDICPKISENCCQNECGLTGTPQCYNKIFIKISETRKWTESAAKWAEGGRASANRRKTAAGGRKRAKIGAQPRSNRHRPQKDKKARSARNPEETKIGQKEEKDPVALNLQILQKYDGKVAHNYFFRILDWDNESSYQLRRTPEPPG